MMRVAEVIATGEKVLPARRYDCRCPGCGAPVYARLPVGRMHHWAHKAGHRECDGVYEEMTAWHLEWQELAPIERREVWCEGRRADMVTASGRVIEVQHSAIGAEEAVSRSAHHYARTGKHVRWIVWGPLTKMSAKVKLSQRWTQPDKGPLATWLQVTWTTPPSWLWMLLESPAAMVTVDWPDLDEVWIIRSVDRVARKDGTTAFTARCVVRDRSVARAQVRSWCEG